MKKILLLPLVALLCMGCSKDALTSDSEMAFAQVTRSDGPYPVRLIMSFNSLFKENRLKLTYEDEDCQMCTLSVGEGTYEFVARGGTVYLTGPLEYEGSAPYVNLKYYPDDESMEYTYGFTMPEEIYLGHSVPFGKPIFGEYYTVRVSFEEAFDS